MLVLFSSICSGRPLWEMRQELVHGSGIAPAWPVVVLSRKRICRILGTEKALHQPLLTSSSPCPLLKDIRCLLLTLPWVQGLSIHDAVPQKNSSVCMPLVPTSELGCLGLAWLSMERALSLGEGDIGFCWTRSDWQQLCQALGAHTEQQGLKRSRAVTY